jgi:hypothetical protein
MISRVAAAMEPTLTNRYVFLFNVRVYMRNTRRVGESASSKLGRSRTESDYRESFTTLSAFGGVAKKAVRGTVRVHQTPGEVIGELK